MQRQDHIPALDGLRGTALLLVVAYHTFLDFPRPHNAFAAAAWQIALLGYSGVDLFFVLSGFLITGIILSTRKSGSFYSAFYGRRALRIFPLYYLAVIITFAFLNRVPFTTQIWFWLNMSNLRTAFHPMAVPYLSHFWSLAVEEQFYLVWPLIVRRVSNRALGFICVGASVISATFRVWHLFPDHGQPDVYYRLTPFHMDGLLVGSGLALLAAESDHLVKWRPLFMAWVGIAQRGWRRGSCGLMTP